MTAQLALSVEPDAPGYYSYWAETKNRVSGCGSVAWFPNKAAAGEAAVAAFDRGYRTWAPEKRPRAEVVRLGLLLAGPDRGLWRDLSDDIRYPLGKDHPWFPSTHQIPDRKATT